jgi:hypothetical protein
VAPCGSSCSTEERRVLATYEATALHIPCYSGRSRAAAVDMLDAMVTPLRTLVFLQLFMFAEQPGCFAQQHCSRHQADPSTLTPTPVSQLSC